MELVDTAIGSSCDQASQRKKERLTKWQEKKRIKTISSYRIKTNKNEFHYI